MNLLFHTIAIEPARWTPQRVSQPLGQLLPRLAAHGFRELEIFEPHLREPVEWPEIQDAFAALEITPVILSSYLDLNPAATPDAELETHFQALMRCVETFSFQKVRLFPGSKISPADADATAIFTERLCAVSARMPDVELLLETHDGSLADDPVLLARLVEEIAAPNVALLYQPTFFDPKSALDQLHAQQHLIRHVHLQNRHPDLSFATLREGVIPWEKILEELDGKAGATLEFVPRGICPVEAFDLEATLRQAREEMDGAESMLEKTRTPLTSA